ncbi:MAG: DNA polymerase III subunit delta [Clostridia bacterium]|nr:DNA polymerase III subunit delta [Clostridia bacterium]
MDKMGFNELKAAVRQGQWQRLYVLTGEEDFLIEKLVVALGEALITPGCEALDRVVLKAGQRGERLDLERVLAEVRTPPFMSRNKLIIVRESGWFIASARQSKPEEADGSREEQDEIDTDTKQNIPSSRLKDNQADLMVLFDQLPASVCLVFIESKVDRRLRSLIQAIERNGVLAEFGKEQPRTLKRWIEAEGKIRGMKIEPVAAESLIDRCDGSMRMIWQELTKIFLYCEATGTKTVTMDLMNVLSIPDVHGSIFDLTDALAEGQTGRALALADKLMSQRQPVQLILFMLTRHVRQLICAAELVQPAMITSSLKVPPFVATRLSKQAARLPADLLESLYKACFETDILIKSGQISDRLGLETLLVDLSTAIDATKRH